MRPYKVVGSVLHGAYGDYYEQMICLRHLKRLFPNIKLVLFFATESRRRELQVFDLSFADEVHSAADICNVPVENFLQFQIRDRELSDNVLSKLPTNILEKFDLTRNLKPWTFIRTIYRQSPADCDIPLSPYGLERLPRCFQDNGLDESKFADEFTVGFLWRYRRPGGHFSTKFQPPLEVIHRTKSELISNLVRQHGAKIIVAGMNLRVTEENRESEIRLPNTPTANLAVPDDACVYLKGLSWGLELDDRAAMLAVHRNALGIFRGTLHEAKWPDNSGRSLAELFSEISLESHALREHGKPSQPDVLFAAAAHFTERVVNYLYAQNLLKSGLIV